MLGNGLLPILIDFGAARLLIAQYSQTVANMLTPGYAPCEQYSNKGQGPWTDIYALGATFYDAMFGKPPPDGLGRIVDDQYKPAVGLGKGQYDAKFLAAIDWALRPLPKDRPQSIKEFRSRINLPVVKMHQHDESSLMRSPPKTSFFDKIRRRQMSMS